MINNGNFGNNMQMKSNMGGNNNNNELIFEDNRTENRISANKNMAFSISRQLMEKNPELEKRNINNLLYNERKSNNL